jgi:hypothetical protein
MSKSKVRNETEVEMKRAILVAIAAWGLYKLVTIGPPKATTQPWGMETKALFCKACGGQIPFKSFGHSSDCPTIKAPAKKAHRTIVRPTISLDSERP